MTRRPNPLIGLRRTGAAATLAAAAAVALLPVVAGPASADGAGPFREGAVFVQLNSTSGNQIATYRRAGDGTLTATGQVATGGRGGTAVNAPIDALASQNSLVLDRDGRLLLAVNAGSDSITSFQVQGSQLRRTSVAPSGGSFPVSIAVHGSLAYVLNAGGQGSISGFRIRDGRLAPIPGSSRSLGLANTNPPVFITAPAQIGFSADGDHLIVTTKANNALLTFGVRDDGRPSAAAISTASVGAVPFSFVVDGRGRVHVTEAGTGAITSYVFGSNGSLVALGSSAGDGGAALCWNIRVGQNIYGANAGSATLSAWKVDRSGVAQLTAPVAVATGAGPIDLAASDNGRFLYAQESGTGTIGVFQIGDDGGLTREQTVTGLPVFNAGGMEGIAAS